MAYATRQDIEDRYGAETLLALADRDGDGQVDATAVGKALADASDEIDSYLAARYPLPLVSVPTVLVRLCVDVAVYRLGYAPGAGADESKATRYKEAIALLRDISRGDASLGITTEAPKAGGAVILNAGPRLFTREKLGGIG